MASLLLLFFKDLINLFLERGEGGRERDRNISQLSLACATIGDQTCNPGMCPDHELN